MASTAKAEPASRRDARAAPSRRRRPTTGGLLTLLVLIVLLGAATVLWIDTALDRPANPGSAPVPFDVRKGQGVSQIAHDLGAAGLVRQGRLFAWLARLRGVDTRIRSGRYELSAALSPREILRRLSEGDVMQVRITIPEGFTRREVARVVAAAGLADEQEFLRVTSDPALLAELRVTGPDLEGYLFPDTYFFTQDAGAPAIARALVEHFREVFDRVLRPRLAARGLAEREAVTLASIVEKESSRDDERPVVAGVFYNRLAKGMRLDSDPTVIYGIPDFDGNLTRAHLVAPSPYNTYAMTGLPVGPIANPGESSLAAVAAPADVPYLFFVSRKDGTHQFSETLAEHERAVQQFQLGRKQNAPSRDSARGDAGARRPVR